MKVATYNIASGGFDGYDSTSSKPERLGLLQKAINTINADIIGLTDTFRWVDTFTEEQLQSAFGYPYSFHIDMNDIRVDKRIGVTLLSRHPIIASQPVRLHNRDAIQATIQIDKNESLEVFVIYLDDLSEATRQLQVQALTELLPKSGSVIVMGDFNAIWPEHVPRVKQQAESWLDTSPDLRKSEGYDALRLTFDNFYKATVMSNFRKQGFTESLELRPTALTSLHPLGAPTIFPVDHILARHCTAFDYHVLTEGILTEASDHNPLVVSIDV